MLTIGAVLGVWLFTKGSYVPRFSHLQTSGFCGCSERPLGGLRLQYLRCVSKVGYGPVPAAKAVRSRKLCKVCFLCIAATGDQRSGGQLSALCGETTC